MRLTLERDPASPDPATTPARDHLVFLLERSQLASISGPYAEQRPPLSKINGVCMRLDDPDLMGQKLTLDESSVVTKRGLRPGVYTLRSYPDDFSFEPAEFELSAPGPHTVTVRWRARPSR